MGFSRQEYWSGLPCPSPGGLLKPGIEPTSPVFPARPDIVCPERFLDTAAAAAANLLQSSLTLCDTIDGSPPGSPVPGILQARTLEWVAVSFSNAWKWKVKVKSLSCVLLFATSWTGSSIHEIFQARELEWGAIAFSVLILQELYRSVYYIKTATCLLPCLLEDPQLKFSSSLTSPAKFSLKPQVLQLTCSFLSLTGGRLMVPN